MYTRRFSGTNIVRPTWFEEAIQQPADSNTFIHNGANIHYRRWRQNNDDPQKRGLLLVHGHAAHTHWFDFIAPGLSDRYDVAAIDLSGSGDSDHRTQYTATGFANEITTCIAEAGLIKPIVVGHSFGGSMTRIAAYLYPERMDGIVLIDSAIPLKRGNRTPPPMPRTRQRFYPDLKEGMRRFRLRPAQPCANDFIIEHIAAHSLIETPEGYCFKLDPAVFAKMPVDEEMPVAWDMIKSITLPVGLVYGEESKFFPPELVKVLPEIIDPKLMAGVTGAHHHVFLDQPLGFLDALITVLERITALASDS